MRARFAPSQFGRSKDTTVSGISLRIAGAEWVSSYAVCHGK